MTDRFSPLEIGRAHLKGLKSRTYTVARPLGTPDLWARGILYVTPVGVGVIFVWNGWTVATPEALLAGYALLAGAFLASFAQMAAWRERLTARAREREVSEVATRDSLDAAVAHVCIAIYVCFLLAAELVVGINFTDSDGRLVDGWAAAAAAGGVFLMLLVSVIVRSLYIAYATMNAVDDEMSGLSR